MKDEANGTYVVFYFHDAVEPLQAVLMVMWIIFGLFWVKNLYERNKILKEVKPYLKLLPGYSPTKKANTVGAINRLISKTRIKG